MSARPFAEIHPALRAAFESVIADFHSSRHERGTDIGVESFRDAVYAAQTRVLATHGWTDTEFDAEIAAQMAAGRAAVHARFAAIKGRQ